MLVCVCASLRLTLIIFVCSIIRSEFVIETQYVSCEVGIKFLNIIYVHFIYLKGKGKVVAVYTMKMYRGDQRYSSTQS